MDKEFYQRTQLIITKFDKEDVIMTSGEEQPVSKKPEENGFNGLQLYPRSW